MVKAELARSSTGVETIFAERDFKAIAVTGGLAALGASAALGAAGMLQSALGRDGPGGMERSDYAVIIAASLLVAMGAVSFVGPGVGGALAIGPLFIIGLSMFGLILGPQVNVDPNDVQMRSLMPDTVSNYLPGATPGCSSCGSSTPTRKVSANAAQGRLGPARAVEQDEAVIDGFR